MADHVVGDLVGALAGREQPLDRLRAGEPPVGQPGRASVAALERVGVEVAAHVVVEVAEGERVARTRGDVEVLRLPRCRRVGQHRDQRRDDVVDRHDVDDGVGGRGELRQLAAPVGQDQRLGHLEALDPARVRALEGGLDDARADDRHRRVLGVRLDDPLAERLGEGVAVGPAEAAGPLGAEPDQLLLDPLLAALLDRRGGGEQPGPAVRPLGLLAEPDESLRVARALVDGLPLRQPPRQLGLEVDVVLDRALGDDCRGAGRRRTPSRRARSGRGHRPREPAPAGRGCRPRWW